MSTDTAQDEEGTSACPPTVVTVIAADATEHRHIELVVTASTDPQIVDATYLPGGLDESAAAIWLARQEQAWVVSVNGSPAGIVSVSTPVNLCGAPLSGVLAETTTWLLEGHRRNGHASAAWKLVEPDLADSFELLVAVIWETNHAAIARVRADSYRFVHRGWFNDTDSEGWCEVWVREPLAGH